MENSLQVSLKYLNIPAIRGLQQISRPVTNLHKY